MVKLKEKLIGYIELIRPGWWPACFFIGLAPGMLAIYFNNGSLNDFFQLKTIGWAFAYWVSIVGIYVFNDYVGIEEDTVINPKRPLPSGRVSKNGALIFSIILLFIGLTLWWLLFQNPMSSFIQFSCIGLIAVYSAVYKNNILLGLGAGLISIGVWIAFAEFNTITIAIFSFLFFWELTLDVPENILHYDGDIKVHPQTFAIKLGKERFAKTGLMFAILTVISILWILTLLNFDYLFLFFAIIGCLTILYSQILIINNIKPMKLGHSLGLVMLSVFIINIGIIIYAFFQSYL